MGKVLSLLLGAIAIIAGVILFAAWWDELLDILKGVVPVILILGGAIAVMSGFSEFKDFLKDKNK
jgi:uncharacterized membrane protein